MKKGIIVGVAIFCCLMFAGSVLAAWDTCAIQRLGVNGASDNLLKVKSCGNSSNNDKWLRVTSQKDTSMAVLLTALSLNKKVKLNADFANGTTNGSSYGSIWVIYLDN